MRARAITTLLYAAFFIMIAGAIFTMGLAQDRVLKARFQQEVMQ